MESEESRARRQLMVDARRLMPDPSLGIKGRPTKRERRALGALQARPVRDPDTGAAAAPLHVLRLEREGTDAPLRPRLSQLSVLFGFVRPYRARVAGAALALLVAAASFLVLGQGLKRVIDQGFIQANPEALNQALIALLGVILVMAAATYTRFYLVSWLGERVPISGARCSSACWGSRRPSSPAATPATS